MRPLPCRRVAALRTVCLAAALLWGSRERSPSHALPPRPGPLRTHARRSKAKVSKKGDKVIITLKKLHKTNWGQLRMNVCLPFRRGGGGT